VRKQGVGSFVAHPKPLTTLFEILSIDDEIKSRGGSHTATVLLLEEEKAFSELADVMKIQVGAPVYHSVIVHKDRGEPCLVLHCQTWNENRVSTHSKFSYPGSRYRFGGRFKPLPVRRSEQ